MAGKNDWGMEGKSWREHMAGKGYSSSKGKVSASIEHDDDDFM